MSAFWPCLRLFADLDGGIAFRELPSFQFPRSRVPLSAGVLSHLNVLSDFGNRWHLVGSFLGHTAVTLHPAMILYISDSA